MRFRKYLVEADVAQQWAFERYLTDKLFPTIKKKFPHVTFHFREQEKALDMMCPVVETSMLDLDEVLNLAERVFGPGVPVRMFYRAAHRGQTGLGFNPTSPEAYPAHVQISDLSVGQWVATAFLENIDKQAPDVERYVADFAAKAKRLQGLADWAVGLRHGQ